MRHGALNASICGKVIAILLVLGLAVCSLLLLVAGYDFGREYFLLSVAPIVFFLAVLWLIGRNTAHAFQVPAPAAPLRLRARLLLVLAIAAGFVASALGCMGLSFFGCTSICMFLSHVWIPLTGAVTLLYLAFPRPGVLAVLLLLCLAFLVPNCACDNVVNHRWIELWDVSPACFSLGITISLASISALYTQRAVRVSGICVWLGVTVCLFFWVGHHFFHFPW